jgi:hypothetical protein
MARVRVRSNFKFADITKQAATASTMREEGERLAVEIENRTLSGVDEDRRKFAPYSPEYQRREKFGSSTVDLHRTGRMFSDFGVVKANRNGFSLGFRTSKSDQIASYHDEGTKNMPQRKFIGVPASWVTALLRRIRERIK